MWLLLLPRPVNPGTTNLLKFYCYLCPLCEKISNCFYCFYTFCCWIVSSESGKCICRVLCWGKSQWFSFPLFFCLSLCLFSNIIIVAFIDSIEIYAFRIYLTLLSVFHLNLLAGTFIMCLYFVCLLVFYTNGKYYLTLWFLKKILSILQSTIVQFILKFSILISFLILMGY